MPVIPPRPNQSSFEYAIELPIDGVARAWLTYSLASANVSYRSLLITDEAKLVPDSLMSAFRDFRTRLPQRSKEKVLRAKHLVNQIYEAPAKHPHMDVAVHKFGPVPVFLIPGDHPIETKHGKLAVRIAIYPFRLNKSQIQRYKFSSLPITCSGAYDFRQCMRVRPRVIFQRYFEDAAEDLCDIAQQLPLAEGLKRAKRVEATLGGSVKSKLLVLIPGMEPCHYAGIPLAQRVALCRESEAQRRWEIFEELAPVLYDAKCVRYFFLYLLNRYYSLLGLASRCQRYLEKLEQVPTEFAMKLGDDRVDELEQSSRVLPNLRKYLGILLDHPDAADGDTLLEKAERLRTEALSAREGWVREIGEFAAFLLYAQSFRKGAHRTRVFLSLPFDVHRAELVAKQIDSHLQAHAPLASIAVGRTQRDVKFRALVSAGIWEADATLAIVPARLDALATTKTKNYRWLGIEADHALRLQKELCFVVEDGTDLNAVSNDLLNPGADYLVTDWRSSDQGARAGLVATHFRDVTHTPFIITDSEPNADSLPRALRCRLDALVTSAVENRAQATLSGMLGQLDPSHRRLLLEVLSILWPRRWLKVERIAERLADRYPNRHRTAELAKGAFQAMWLKAKERAIFIERRSGKATNISLLRIGTKRRYFTSMLALAVVYFPQKSPLRSRAWLMRVLKNEYHKVNAGTRFGGGELRFD